jgi:NCAIR mutase (PurE)-related protein
MDLRARLESFRRGEISLDELCADISGQRVLDIGPARLDLDRSARCGLDEAVYASGKSAEDLLLIVETFIQRRGRVLITRLRADQAELLQRRFPEIQFAADEKTAFVLGEDPARVPAQVAVVTGGSSDRAIAAEIGAVLTYYGISSSHYTDVGIAGIERLFNVLEPIRSCDLSIVVAGMEGTLPGVVAGLVHHPVIAVPSSVGYGANFEGLSALLAMLTSCAPGIAVVNIDNGFGAAALAAKMVRMQGRKSE